MRIVVFGANGGTGRELTRQALGAGHDVVAVTRSPATFPIENPQLTVVEADVYDQRATVAAVSGADVVLSTLGIPFTREVVDVYSVGIAAILEAMRHHGVKRVVAVSSSAVEPHRHADGGFLLDRVLQPLVIRTIGKTTYDDMRVMEATLRASEFDWTIVRPSGLFDADVVTDYRVTQGHSDGVFTSRADLAAFLLAQADSTEHVGKTVEVTTHEGTPSLWSVLRRESAGNR